MTRGLDRATYTPYSVRTIWRLEPVMYLYSLAYRIDQGRRVVHRTVVARDADDARERVKAVDSRFIATVRSPRRGRAVVEEGAAHV